MMMNEALLLCWKYNQRPHWEVQFRWLYRAEDRVLGEIPAGTMFRHQTRKITFPVAYRTLLFFPLGHDWNAELAFRPDGRLHEVYTNVALAPGVGPRRLDWVDLDLDVVWQPGSPPALLDEDEFRIHQALMDYPPEVIAAAERRASWLMSQAQAGAPPFCNWTWDEAVATLKEMPLTE
jgi:protein associated with RNAse G/E